MSILNLIQFYKDSRTNDQIRLVVVYIVFFNLNNNETSSIDKASLIVSTIDL